MFTAHHPQVAPALPLRHVVQSEATQSACTAARPHAAMMASRSALWAADMGVARRGVGDSELAAAGWVD